jgi:hypothetical protein
VNQLITKATASMFIAELAIAKPWKQPRCPTADE